MEILKKIKKLFIKAPASKKFTWTIQHMKTGEIYGKYKNLGEALHAFNKIRKKNPNHAYRMRQHEI